MWVVYRIVFTWLGHFAALLGFKLVQRGASVQAGDSEQTFPQSKSADLAIPFLLMVSLLGPSPLLHC
jgi:hypothetical protein